MSLPTPPAVAHCYRHPNRETGRSCTRCGKPACSDCLVQATVGSHCLDCAKAARPDIKSRAQMWNARQMTPVTIVFMAINIAVFVWMGIEDSGSLTGDVTFRHIDLSLNAIPLKLNNEWYRLVTAGFVQFGILHLAFNMFALYQLGQMVERSMSHVKFGLLYFASLLGGSLGALLLQGSSVSPTAGASGAIFGLLGAAAVGLHRRGVSIFSTGIGTALMLNLVITFSIPEISIGGHLGGLVAGALCGWVMLAPHWKPVPKWAGYAVPIAIGALCVVISVLFVRTVNLDDVDPRYILLWTV